MTDTILLSQARRGDRGVIVQVGGDCHHDEHKAELERRLLELGFVEGARVELTAAAKPGFTFHRWTGSCSGSEPTCVVRTSRAKSVGARFSPAA